MPLSILRAALRASTPLWITLGTQNYQERQVSVLSNLTFLSLVSLLSHLAASSVPINIFARFISSIAFEVAEAPKPQGAEQLCNHGGTHWDQSWGLRLCHFDAKRWCLIAWILHPHLSIQQVATGNIGN